MTADAFRLSFFDPARLPRARTEAWSPVTGAAECTPLPPDSATPASLRTVMQTLLSPGEWTFFHFPAGVWILESEGRFQLARAGRCLRATLVPGGVRLSLHAAGCSYAGVIAADGGQFRCHAAAACEAVPQIVRAEAIPGSNWWEMD